MAQEEVYLVNSNRQKDLEAQAALKNNFDELYAGIGAGVPGSRTIEINGTSYDLSANRTYTVTDASLSTSDIITNNSSTTKHGFLKKLSNVATEYMDGQGNWSTPPSSGVSDGDKGDITVSSSGTVWTIDIGLDPAKLADGSVSATEFQYINSLSSNAQTQITARMTFPQVLAISSLRL
jgi:hypothetical protein